MKSLLFASSPFRFSLVLWVVLVLSRGWEDLSLHPGQLNSLSRVFTNNPLDRSTQLFIPLVFDTDMTDGASIAEALMSNENIAGTGDVASQFSLAGTPPSEVARSFRISLANGNDGDQSLPSDYLGTENSSNSN